MDAEKENYGRQYRESRVQTIETCRLGNDSILIGMLIPPVMTMRFMHSA